MLRKRTRSAQKDQQMGHKTPDGGSDSETRLQSDVVLGQRQKTNAFFNVPGLFVGLNPMSSSECDSVRSPTSPLDFKLFSNLSNSFRFPKPSVEGNQKSWDCNKVGLGSIVDSLDDCDDGRNLPEKPIPLSNSKTILIGLQIRSKGPNSPRCDDFRGSPKSMPKNYPIFPNTKLRSSNLQKGSSDVLFEIGGDPLETDPSEMIQSFSLDSKRVGLEFYRLGTRKLNLRTPYSRFEKESIPGVSTSDLIGSGNIARTLSPEEIELSEDYTCVISRGPVPKTTHIFGDLVLECHPSGVEVAKKTESSEAALICSEKYCQILAPPSPYPTTDFLSYCYHCKKKLEAGKDIYMYRGEKAFCSCECRLEEISIEEEHENSTNNASKSENGDNNFEKSIFAAI
ncbi:FCS-Like Zinc finger 10-like [Silene latifolia]|uniref:FCS-Like Zinc finger 10-like n=1 Tax=Silene latifolia TaxID=37657 RepID=UPI003D775BFE